MELPQKYLLTRPKFFLRFLPAFIGFFFSFEVHSENYYQHNACPRGTQKSTTIVGSVDKEEGGPSLLPRFNRDQGNSLTCGFHTSIVMLDSIRKFKGLYIQGDLSTADAILRYGRCQKNQTGETSIDASTSPAAFLITLASQFTLGVDEKEFTVKMADEANQFLLAQPRGWNEPSKTVSNDYHLPIKSILESQLREEPIPEFSLIVKDFPQVSDEKDRFEVTRRSLLDYFRTGNPVGNIFPVGLATCFSDDDEKKCLSPHSVALTKIEKVECLDSSKKVINSFNDAWIVNSWGTISDKPFHLEKMIEGMARHRMGFVQIRPCPKNENCRTSPIENEQDSQAFPLYHYAESGDVKNSKRLIKIYGARRILPSMINQPGEMGATPLFKAALAGQLSIVKELIHAQAILNLPLPTGATALYVAAQEGHLDIVKELIHAKANLDLAEADGTSPLIIAAQNGHLQIVKELIHAKANVNLPKANGSTALTLAAVNRHPEIVDQLILAKANVEKTLSATIRDQSWDAADLIISELLHLAPEKFIFSPEQLRNLKTALEIATKSGKQEIVNYLYSVGVK